MRQRGIKRQRVASQTQRLLTAYPAVDIRLSFKLTLGHNSPQNKLFAWYCSTWRFAKVRRDATTTRHATLINFGDSVGETMISRDASRLAVAAVDCYHACRVREACICTVFFCQESDQAKVTTLLYRRGYFYHVGGRSNEIAREGTLTGRGRNDKADLMFGPRHAPLVVVGNAPHDSRRILYRALNLLLIAQTLAYRQDAFIGYSEKHSTDECSSSSRWPHRMSF